MQGGSAATISAGVSAGSTVQFVSDAFLQNGVSTVHLDYADAALCDNGTNGDVAAGPARSSSRRSAPARAGIAIMAGTASPGRQAGHGRAQCLRRRRDFVVSRADTLFEQAERARAGSYRV